MEFNIVIGNPPYDRTEIQLDFVTLGHKLSTDCSVWITPAKWQSKGGEKNEQFRRNMVPHMRKIVYYPYCIDVFDIWETSGVCYFIIDKNEVHSVKEVENICSTQEYFNSKEQRAFNSDFTLLNICDLVVRKIDLQYRFTDRIYSESNRYQIWMNNQSSGGLLFSLNKGSILVLEPAVAVDIENPNNFRKTSVHKLIFSSNNKEETKSFYSWINTKFIRFLVLARAAVMTGILNDYCWKFVPDPGAFDHIFTDEEFYKKYNLTDEEINIIESVIKERK